MSAFSLNHHLLDAVPGLCVRQPPATFPDAQVLRVNHALSTELQLDLDAMQSELPAWLSGASLPEGSEPVAVAYAGHQFGHLTPQLGDGRALLMGEIDHPSGAWVDVQLKGSGRTPFSRNGDGRAALDSVLREYLVSEAMHAMGVPTTRALAALTTGERIWRERRPPGAVLVRLASSHLRVGTLVFQALRQDEQGLRQVVEHALERHATSTNPEQPPALQLLHHVARVQAELIAQWMALGFVHGVMNTDNVTLSGETLDYGPCAFMDKTDLNAVFSEVDHGGRYAYAQQPSIGLWNLARMAEALLPLLAPTEEAAMEAAHAALDAYRDHYENAWHRRMGAKLGIDGATPADAPMFEALLTHMNRENLDFTQTFRSLAEALRSGERPLGGALGPDWEASWRERRSGRADAAVAQAMDAVNPVYIPRNHHLERALDAALEGDLVPFDTLFEVVTHPFEKRAEWAIYEAPPPKAYGQFRTHCNT